MNRREKEDNIPLKNAVKRKSNSYNRQQMKSQIKIKNKKKPNTQCTRKHGNQHNQNQLGTAQMKSKNNTQTRSAQENKEINTIKINSIQHR